MIRLTGTLKERLDMAIRIAHTDLSENEYKRCLEFYKMAGIKLLPSAEAFIKKYGGVFRDHFIVLYEPAYTDLRNRQIFFECYAVIMDECYDRHKPHEWENEILKDFNKVMQDFDSIRTFAGQEVCPVACIGHYYPADVFVGENGLLYCSFDYQQEFEIFREPSDILEYYLYNEEPIGIELIEQKT